VSPTAHGNEAKIQDRTWKHLCSTVSFLRSTSDCSILIQDIPINKDTLLVGFPGASWADSQALEQPAKLALLDWKSAIPSFDGIWDGVARHYSSARFLAL